MPEKADHYLSLEKLSLLYRYYAYFDTADYLADALFIKHQVRVAFQKEYCKDGFGYTLIFCRIRKKDEAAFLEALRELPAKMLICSHTDYAIQCKQFMETIEAEKKGGDAHETDDTFE